MTTTGRRVPPALPRTVLAVGPDPALVEAVLTGLAGGAVARAGGLALHRGPEGLQLLHAVGPTPRPAAVQAGLRVAGGVLLVVPAVGGPDPAAVQVWERCAAEQRARALVVTGFDAPGADYDEAVALGQRLLGDDLHPLVVPMHGDDDAVAGVLDVLRLAVADSSSGVRVPRHPDPEHTALVGGLRDDLVEALLADSDDASLLERYLEGAPLSLPTLSAELAAVFGGGRVAPALAVSGVAGVAELAALLAFLPGPPGVLALDADGGALHVLEPDPDAAAVVEVLAPAGGCWLVAVRAGTLRTGQRLLGATGELVVGDLASPLPAGAVASVPGLDGAVVGGALGARPVRLEVWPLPEPLHAVDAADVPPGCVRRDPTVHVDEHGLAWFLDADHVRETLGGSVPAAELGDEPVDVRVEVGAALARPARRALARHASGDVARSEHEERNLALLSATVPARRLAALADDLRQASAGTAWTRRVP